MSFLNALCALPTRHDHPDRSMSPMFSNVGLCFAPNGAQADAVLHYNRKTRGLFTPFVRFAGPCRTESTFLCARFLAGAAAYTLCFYDTDAFIVSGKNAAAVELFCSPDAALRACWQTERTDTGLMLHLSSLNGDDRDPDPAVPVLLGLRVLRGALTEAGGKTLVQPDGTGRVLFAVAVQTLTPCADTLRHTLAAAPADPAAACDRVRSWAAENTAGLTTLPADVAERRVYLTAAAGLLMNLTLAPGSLAGRVSAFPSRGGYPTHFMWDTAFQNLAYELMRPALAADGLLQLARGVRPDGKIPQFLCSTWARPGFTQPALLGWAARRLTEQAPELRADKAFAAAMADALARNDRWWLTQRATACGLLYCEDGLETGQDDSPRFDDGPVLAVDMNSYLLSQLRATAYFYRLAGQSEPAAAWEAEAARFADLLVRRLYDEGQNLFFDADAATGERRGLVTLSCFIPLWAGVPLPEAKQREMIRTYLLDPARFFGSVPFPCVARTEAVYDPAGWWRGPTWMPTAWLMLETLERFGFAEERAAAMERLFGIMTADGALHELFNSQTGEGLGCSEQGWTAAVYIRLARELGRTN